MLGWKKQYEQKSGLQKAWLVSRLGLSQLQRTDNPGLNSFKQKATGLLNWMKQLKSQEVSGIAGSRGSNPGIGKCLSPFKHLPSFFLAWFSEGHLNQRARIGSDWCAPSLSRGWVMP